MNAIDITLAKLKKEGRTGLMTHAVIGYPSLTETVSLAKTMAKAGADFIELQIPFSDPLADGPTIMKACEHSLRSGTRVADAFIIAKAIGSDTRVPLLFMAYYNTVFKYGPEKFCRDAAKAGLSGLIVPDMPLEEEVREHFSQYAKKHGLHVVRVIAPVSTVSRLKKNALHAQGFIYCSARQGITGVRSELSSDLSSYLANVRKFFKVPIAVGFGISKPEHVKSVSSQADIAVVGSAIIDVINRSNKKMLLKNVRDFVRALKGVPR